MALTLRQLPPHEIYQDPENAFETIRHCGKKTTAQIIEITEKYRRDNSRFFCECGEPYLHWYNFCPECGKEKESVRIR